MSSNEQTTSSISRIDDLEKENAELKSRLKSIDDRNSYLKGELQAKDKEIDALQSSLSHFHDSIKKRYGQSVADLIVDKIDELKKIKIEIEKSHEDRVKEILKESNKFFLERNSLRKELSKVRKDNSKTESQMEKELSRKYDKRIQDAVLRERKKQEDNLKIKVASYKFESEEDKKKIADLNNLIKAKDKELRFEQNQRAEATIKLRDEISRLERELESKQSEITEIKDRYKNDLKVDPEVLLLAKSIEELRDIRSDLKKEIKNLINHRDLNKGVLSSNCEACNKPVDFCICGS
ncbi:hypothetical protein [Motiliproteus sediminis]|uniref:hypothetical protein n=1 Tax=Motiliproteus sediminis TaxID=1468178 RepID=UPI001AEF65A0|nr:hypothetical protein [Motiliproteus sediminis]